MVLTRNCNQILKLSWLKAGARARSLSLSKFTRLAAIRLNHCFGFNMFKYCVYADGFFERLATILNKHSMIISDTNALDYMLSSLKKRKSVKVCSIVNSSKVAKLATCLNCTKSCVQLDVWAKMLSHIKRKNLIFAIATSPTSLLRLSELMRARIIKPSIIVACPVGFVNCNASKRLLWLNNFCETFLILRSRLGGVAFGAAIINSLT
ncbi:Precorrin-8X methylmutase [Candidatus Hodgkinia cicadicola]|nr:Precorrin-8X methylmutase [Candidatus Hodgkinia cicadicola]